MTRLVIIGAGLSWGLAGTCFAGKAMKWEDVPEAVRQTVLANGGSAGLVDKEGEKIGGKAVYEASIKDKNGNVADLVITEDGKLVETKHDDPANQPEKMDGAAKILANARFTHPREITNPFLPLATLKKDVLAGTEAGKKVLIERIARPELHKTFKVGAQEVEALVVEDRETEDGQIAEVAIDYFAQSDDGTVFYLGEDVSEYTDGKVTSHEGSWLLGKDTQTPGIILPGHPKVGQKFKSEDVSKEINETDEVISVSEKVTAPSGKFRDCVKVKERLADGTIEYKYYAMGVGVVREVPSKGDVLLKSHESKGAR